jgi:hypothetical protein
MSRCGPGHSTRKLQCRLNSMAKLEDMPFEILGLIIQNLERYSVKLFSMVNKQCRAATTSTLFRAITIEFSRSGMKRLQGIANSLFAPSVKVLHYEASELLDPCMSILWFQLLFSLHQ